MVATTPAPDSLGFCVDEWVTSLKAAGRAENTITSYLFSIGWLKKANVFDDSVDIHKALTPATIERTLFAMRNGGLKTGTQGLVWRSLRVFSRFLTKRHVLTSAPSDAVSPPKQDAEPKVVPEQGDLDAFIADIDAKTTDGARDVAVIRVLLTTGLRRGELAGLDIEDWDQTQHTLQVREGKSRFSRRRVYIPANTEDALYRWLRARQRFAKRNPHLGLANDSGPLFIAIQRHAGHRITGQAIERMLKRRSAKAGLDLHPHLLRHAFAHFSLAQGLSDLDVASALGHRDSTLLALVYGASRRESRSLAAYAALDGRRSR